MTTTIQQVLDFVYDNNVKFIRLSFCDLNGTHKNISIMPSQLESAFYNGISFDGSAIKGFENIKNSDLFLFPDPTTLSVLPWRPNPGRVVRFYCDIKKPDGTAYINDARALLKKAVNHCRELGYHCKIGAECEFYLFKTDEDGNATSICMDNGGYLDIAPLDKGENIRREICLTLEEIGIEPECSHHEQGPGQNEIDFKFGDALSCADNILSFKSLVKAISYRNGLYASFMPKPIADAAGNGMHVNISLTKNGKNIFKNANTEQKAVSESFIAGILEKTAEITSFLNPTNNSYDRLGKFEAPKYVSWSHNNRSQLIRIPAAIDDRLRMELRSPDSSVNPYLCFALIIEAGLSGIEKGLELPASYDEDLFNLDSVNSLTQLPQNLGEALELSKNSDFLKDIMGKDMLNNYITLKTNEYNSFVDSPNKEKFNKENYFNII